MTSPPAPEPARGPTGRIAPLCHAAAVKRLRRTMNKDSRFGPSPSRVRGPRPSRGRAGKQRRSQPADTPDPPSAPRATRRTPANHYSEETKALATEFLILDPDGRVHRECRVPRRRHSRGADGSNPEAATGVDAKLRMPTSDDLSERQLAVTFTHQALAAREALLKNASVRKRILALILHEKVRSEELSFRHDANGTTLAASVDDFVSPAFDRLKDKRSKLDPFEATQYVEDVQAYEELGRLSAAKLDALIDLLIVNLVTAHMVRPTALVQRLAEELKVNVRDDWRPDGPWLSSFRKIQLAHLIVELRGPVHAPAPESKKSALVESLAKLFSAAAAGTLEDKQLATTVNAWIPSNLRRADEEGAAEHRDANKYS